MKRRWGGKERKANWTSKTEREGEVSERIGSMDRFIRQAVAFFPIIRKHFRGPSRDNEAIAPLGDLQPIQGRYKMLAAFTPHSYTHTQPLVAHLWLFSLDNTPLHPQQDLKRIIYPIYVSVVVSVEWLFNVWYFNNCFSDMKVCISKRRTSTHLQHHRPQGIFVNHTLACWWDISLLHLLLICCCSFFCWPESQWQKFRSKK